MMYNIVLTINGYHIYYVCLLSFDIIYNRLRYSEGSRVGTGNTGRRNLRRRHHFLAHTLARSFYIFHSRFLYS